MGTGMKSGLKPGPETGFSQSSPIRRELLASPESGHADSTNTEPNWALEHILGNGWPLQSAITVPPECWQEGHVASSPRPTAVPQEAQITETLKGARKTGPCRPLPSTPNSPAVALASWSKVGAW